MATLGSIISRVPAFGWLRTYTTRRFGLDLLAGLSLAAFVIPESLAYASLAQLPPVTGLYCYLVAGIAYALFGTSRQLAVGPTSALAIVIVSLSSWILSTRSLVISNIGEDYLLYAEAKGLKPRKVMIGYALRNAMLPQATGLALTIGSMMSGQLLIESMFVYPGLGQVMSRAIGIFDYNTMMGIIILSVVSVMTASLIVDLLLPVIDPRIRTAVKA